MLQGKRGRERSKRKAKSMACNSNELTLPYMYVRLLKNQLLTQRNVTFVNILGENINFTAT